MSLARLVLPLLIGSIGSISRAETVEVGSPIARPESVTGVWETRLSSNEILGLSIAEVSTVPGSSTTLVGVEQTIKFIRIVTYLRRGDHSDRTLWFTGEPGGFSWSGRLLRLHAADIDDRSKPIDLDLSFDSESSKWRGSVARPGFSGRVDLARPHGVVRGAPVGFWRSGGSGVDQWDCVHVGIGEDGRFALWSDVVTLNGLTHYGNGLAAPPLTDENYGELADDPMERQTGSAWHFSDGNGLGGDTLDGTLTSDGSTFAGTAVHFGNGFGDGVPRPFAWHRISGDSCVADGV